MVIWEENHSASAITPSAAPHISAYAADCGLATDYQSLTHPSLPNYLAATSGASYASSPWSSDCQASSCTTSAENLFDQVGPAGWKGYAESMTTSCQRSNSGEYVSRHNPAVYYTDLGVACAADDVPLGTTAGGSLLSDVQAGTLPTVSTVTPNLIDDMHDGTVAQGDAWLGEWIPVIAAGPDYRSGRLTVVIAWDEGSGSGNLPSTVDAIVMSPSVHAGTRSGTLFTHYSLLKAEEDVAGVPELGQAATANSLRTAFGF
jgi:phospholipase C